MDGQAGFETKSMFYNCLRTRSLICYLLSLKSSFSFTYTAVASRQVSWPFDNLSSNANLALSTILRLFPKDPPEYKCLIMSSIIVTLKKLGK